MCSSLDQCHDPRYGIPNTVSVATQPRRPEPFRQECLLDDLEPASSVRSGPQGPVVQISGRRFETTVVFDTFWRFAAARQGLYEARLARRPGPWTDDPILRQHRFTNCFRAADRVSQFGIQRVAYSGPQDPREVIFRILLFKMFNKIETWRLLEDALGDLTWATFDPVAYDEVLSGAFGSGTRLYSAAYVVPPPAFGAARKHTNHLRLIEFMMRSGVADRVLEVGSMSEAFELLRGCPAMGDFLAYQFLIDINYSTAINFDEMDFVVPGPGARDGIRKCFGPPARGFEADIIRYMAEHQAEHFSRLGLTFRGLRGRPLQLIDCQNLFCEVDKYARVAHPEVAGVSGRTRIKQRFAPSQQPLPAWFPPKWGLAAEPEAIDLAWVGEAPVLV